MIKKLLLLCTLLIPFNVTAGIPLSTNFTVNTALPIDDRMLVADLTARDAISSLKRWQGMLVYVTSEGKHFTLVGGITNGDWTELSGTGGGGGSTSTALMTSATMTINGDPTKFDIPAFTAIFVDNYTNPLVPVTTTLNYAGSTANVATNIGTSAQTNVFIDKLGNIIQSTVPITTSQTRDYVEIGSLIHLGGTISSIVSYTGTNGIDVASGVHDLSYALGPINISGNIFKGNSGSTLKIDKSAGTTFEVGSNWATSKKDPNIITDASLTAPTFFLSRQDGIGGFTVGLTDTITPALYDDGDGTLGTVTTNRWQLFKIYRIINQNSVAIEYGQVTYSSLASAIAAKSTATTVNPSTSGLQFRGWYAVRGGATDLNNIADGLFIDAGKFSQTTLGGALGTSTTSLQGAYDNSTSPQILTSTTLGSFDIKRGSAADTDFVFKTINGASATTSSITGAGVLTASSFIGSALKITDVPRRNTAINPNFEGGNTSGVATGWTNLSTNSTPIITTEVMESGSVNDGLQAQKITLTAGQLNFSQDVSTNTGVETQWVVGGKYKIPSALGTFGVCSVVAGVEQNCVPTSKLFLDNIYHSIEIPTTIVPGQTVGIKFKTTVNASASAYIDDVYINQGLGLTPVNLVETDSLTSNTATNGALTDSGGEVQFSSVTASSSNVIDVVQDGANTRTKFVAKKDCIVNVTIGSNISISSYSEIYKNGVLISRGASSYATTRNSIASAAIELLTGEYVTVGGTTSSSDYTFTMTAQSIVKTNVYQSLNGNYSLKNVGTITIGSSAGGSPTKGTISLDRILAARYGQQLKANYQYYHTAAGATATASGDYLFSLPIIDGVQTQFDSTVQLFSGTLNSASQVSAMGTVGTCSANDGGFQNIGKLIAYDSTKFRCFYGNGSNGVTITGYNMAVANNPFMAVTMAFGLQLDAPMLNWANSNVIVGSFAGVPNVAGLNTPKLFGANITTTSGAITNNKGGVISSCTAANPTVCTLVGLTNTPICTYIKTINNNTLIDITAKSNTSVTLYSVLASTNAAAATQTFDLSCWGD